MNPILLTDSYKVTQFNQYPPDTRAIYSYFESRGGLFNETTFFGLQYILKKYFMKRVKAKHLAEAREVLGLHFGKALLNVAGWQHIIDHHNGHIPLRIKAVPEGTTVPVSNVLMTVENTCEKCYWVPNYFETLLVQAWYPTTVATLSRQIKKQLVEWTQKTGGDVESVLFKLHDFGFRGVSSVESAGIGGLAHLVNFEGTDTMKAFMVGRKYYGHPMAGFSIPASEHSTMTAWGKEYEAAAYQNMLDQFPTGLVAVVSDSYDIFNACRNIWGDKLKTQVMDRKGTVVIRPDSGDPADVVKQVLDILGEQFGYTVNRKGYKMLPPYVRVIQGDGCDYGMIKFICEKLKFSGWCTDNVAFGMGGALLQKLHRDTQRFAFKCAARKTANGLWLPVSKNPVTDPGKKSKAGRMKLVKNATGGYETAPDYDQRIDHLVTVYDHGELRGYTLDQIRERAA